MSDQKPKGVYVSIRTKGQKSRNLVSYRAFAAVVRAVEAALKGRK
jgi:hypothetical protein